MQAWTGAENAVTTGIRYPDRLIRSDSLYRLSHPGPHRNWWDQETKCATRRIPTLAKIGSKCLKCHTALLIADLQRLEMLNRGEGKAKLVLPKPRRRMGGLELGLHTFLTHLESSFTSGFCRILGKLQRWYRLLGKRWF